MDPKTDVDSKENEASSSSTAPASTAIKTMKLYSQPGQMLKNEIAERKLTDPKDIASLGHLHYHGTEALRIAAKYLREAKSGCHRLLDVGAGLGSTARFMFLEYDDIKEVMGLELQKDLVKDGNEVTVMVNLDPKEVNLVTGSIYDGPPGEDFDGAISILVILHLEDKEKALRNIAASLRKGGRLVIEDFLQLKELESLDKELLSKDVFCKVLTTKDEYVKLLEKCGFRVDVAQDLSESWTKFVTERAEAFRNDKERHVRVHGDEAYRGRQHFYDSVCKLFTRGNVGGIRLCAEKL